MQVYTPLSNAAREFIARTIGFNLLRPLAEGKKGKTVFVVSFGPPKIIPSPPCKSLHGAGPPCKAFNSMDGVGGWDSGGVPLMRWYPWLNVRCRVSRSSSQGGLLSIRSIRIVFDMFDRFDRFDIQQTQKCRNANFEGIQPIVPGFFRIGIWFERILGRLA